MKNLFSVLLIAAALFVVSCGGGANKPADVVEEEVVVVDEVVAADSACCADSTCCAEGAECAGTAEACAKTK